MFQRRAKGPFMATESYEESVPLREVSPADDQPARNLGAGMKFMQATQIQEYCENENDEKNGAVKKLKSEIKPEEVTFNAYSPKAPERQQKLTITIDTSIAPSAEAQGHGGDIRKSDRKCNDQKADGPRRNFRQDQIENRHQAQKSSQSSSNLGLNSGLQLVLIEKEDGVRPSLMPRGSSQIKNILQQQQQSQRNNKELDLALSGWRDLPLVLPPPILSPFNGPQREQQGVKASSLSYKAQRPQMGRDLFTGVHPGEVPYKRAALDKPQAINLSDQSEAKKLKATQILIARRSPSENKNQKLISSPAPGLQVERMTTDDLPYPEVKGMIPSGCQVEVMYGVNLEDLPCSNKTASDIIPLTDKYKVFKYKNPQSLRMVHILRCGFDGCHRVFRKWHNFYDHIRFHTRERPYRCPFAKQLVCNFAFTQKSNLNKHVTSHLQQYPNLLTDEEVAKYTGGQVPQLVDGPQKRLGRRLKCD